MRYVQWKKLRQKKVKKNAKKTTAFCTSMRTVAIETSKFPCPACKRIERNSILCVKCNYWAHKSSGFTEIEQEMTINGDDVEKVAKFWRKSAIFSALEEECKNKMWMEKV